jgi:hypothetical protein
MRTSNFDPADIAQHAYQRVLDDGGVTINLQGHEPQEGYAYSPYPELERILPSQLLNPQAVHSYLRDREDALAQPGHHLGLWHDQDTGNVFMDVSVVGPAHEDTVSEASKAKQKAVWDIKNQIEIPTGANINDRLVTSAADHQAVLDANRGQNLQGLPGAVNVPGYGPLQFHAHGDIQRVANEYNAANGLGAHPTDYQRVNPERSAQIAQAYEQMPHAPNDPTVRGAYDALARETRAQYDHAVRNGYQFEFYPNHDPYPNSPREAVLDLHHNKHMYVYPTESGYGQGNEDPGDHPLLGDSGVRWNGKPVTHNDLFRAVHDFYGHAKEGLGFRADGEDNAYRQHAAMFSPLARKALTAETRGQNSWVNYGPHGATNQTAGQGDTVYAEQKAGILPDWVEDPNLHRTASFKRQANMVGYHVSPRRNRESIMAQGLRGHERGWGGVGTLWNYTWDQPPGNYFFHNEDDARDYVANLHNRFGKQTYDEDRLVPHPMPEGWEQSPTHQQAAALGLTDPEESWQEHVMDHGLYDEIEDDPNGYDIYKLHLTGKQMAPDPELRNFYKDDPWDLGRIHDTLEENQQVMERSPNNWYDNPHAMMADEQGATPLRSYTPEHVEPERIQLHEHHPSWDIPEMEGVHEFAQPWAMLPWTEVPMPGHESRRSEAASGPSQGDPDLYEGPGLGWDIPGLRTPETGWKLKMADTDTWTPMARPLPKNLDDHNLAWEPGTEGKGFILENGTVWTWPTENMRPMHMQKVAPVKALGGRVRPETPFHIDPDGTIYQVGPGRKLKPLDLTRLQMADRRLKSGQAPSNADELGHSQKVYDAIRNSAWYMPDVKHVTQRPRIVPDPGTRPEEAALFSDHWQISPVQECPNCHAMTPIYNGFCPHCGEFVLVKTANDDDQWTHQYGDITIHDYDKDEPWGTNVWAQRRPVVYDHETNEMEIGGPGDTHVDMSTGDNYEEGEINAYGGHHLGYDEDDPSLQAAQAALAQHHDLYYKHRAIDPMKQASKDDSQWHLPNIHAREKLTEDDNWDDLFKLTGIVPDVVMGQTGWPDSEHAEFTEDDPYYLNRHPYAEYDGRIYLGQHGTHHVDLIAEHGVPIDRWGEVHLNDVGYPVSHRGPASESFHNQMAVNAALNRMRHG